ncbi:hypothetical protein [Natronomonas amylolytica]|uniref:hypothetical protein n=1 Tax=Natronomonas amylolytica TaxID=3108498 RepID=UPI00300B6145
MDEDWDNLLLLDACRYDLFKEVNAIQGTLEYRLSKGSYTGGFFEGNFSDTEHHDTVYVTANPVPRVEEWCSVNVDTVFHDVIDVWETNWDEQENTVRPKPVADAIEKAHADYPDKRILGHFIQPHQPFIGKTGQKIDETGMEAYSRITGDERPVGKQVWKQLEDGEIPTEVVWQAYTENLELALPYVQDLCTELTGKTVVTSDHGNLFGEFAWPFPVRKYGHPVGVHTKKLIKVPWLETEFKERREITSESPNRTESETDEEERLKRLQHLGYR